MKSLLALTKNTFRETIRDRILLVIAFFGVLLIVATQLLSSLSIRQDAKMVVDLGLGMIDIFGMLITIFVGTQLIFREINQKTIFIILSKPISRGTFLLSKFFGLGSILLLITSIMFAVFIGIIIFSTDLLVQNDIIQFSFLGEIALIVLFSLLSFLLLLALVLFFSSFMSPTIAAFSALTVFILGHITDDLRMFAQAQESSLAFQRFADTIYYAFPNFSSLNLKNFVLSDIPFSGTELLASFAGAVFWIALATTLATLFFSRKEF